MGRAWRERGDLSSVATAPRQRIGELAGLRNAGTLPKAIPPPEDGQAREQLEVSVSRALNRTALRKLSWYRGLTRSRFKDIWQ